jgi:hypothetical protein
MGAIKEEERDSPAVPLVTQEARLAALLLQKHFLRWQAVPVQGSQQLAGQGAANCPDVDISAQEWTAHLISYGRGCLATLSHLVSLPKVSSTSPFFLIVFPNNVAC